MDENQKVFKTIEYTGTIESFNQLVDNLGDDPYFPYAFIDDNGQSTWKFTGTILVHKTGVIYKPGNSYLIEIRG